MHTIYFKLACNSFVCIPLPIIVKFHAPYQNTSYIGNCGGLTWRRRVTTSPSLFICIMYTIIMLVGSLLSTFFLQSAHCTYVWMCGGMRQWSRGARFGLAWPATWYSCFLSSMRDILYVHSQRDLDAIESRFVSWSMQKWRAWVRLELNRNWIKQACRSARHRHLWTISVVAWKFLL